MQQGALAGVRIVDLTNVVFGSYGTSILGDLGADVIKIEPPATELEAGGDIMRHPGHPPEGSPPGMGPIFLTINRNKRSIALDLATPGGREAVQALIATADVFASNIRMAALERLDLDYRAVAAIKRDIVYTHAAGYGSGGPDHDKPAYDDVIQAQCGLAGLWSRVNGGDPRFAPSIIADKTSGLFMAYAILAALFHRERTGEGRVRP